MIEAPPKKHESRQQCHGAGRTAPRSDTPFALANSQHPPVVRLAPSIWTYFESRILADRVTFAAGAVLANQAIGICESGNALNVSLFGWCIAHARRAAAVLFPV